MNILFVGHSMLYWAPNGDPSLTVPALFQQLAQLGGQEVTISASYIGGGSMQDHWNDTSGVNARAEIASGTYDVVMLNGRLWDDTTFATYADMFADLVKDSGAEAMFYGLWPGDWEISAAGDTQTARTAAYLATAQRNDAAYVPNADTYGAVYRELVRQYGGDGTTAENLLTVDSVHTTALGGYVVANTMYWTYFNAAPPPASLWRPAGVSLADAEMVQRIVAETVKANMIPLVPAVPVDPANAEIGGRCFFDDDGNGVDDADAGVAGVTVSLLLDGQVVATTTSGADGSYAFTGLKAGAYSVEFALNGTAWRFVAGNSGTNDGIDSDVLAADGATVGRTADIVLAASQTEGTTDAGLKLPVVVVPVNAPPVQPTAPDAGDIVITGTAAGEIQPGTGANDHIQALGGDDLVHSMLGDDYVDGGAGRDTLYGGMGADTFLFDTADSMQHGGAGIDRVLFRTPGAVDASTVGMSSIEIFDLANRFADDITFGYQQMRRAADAELRIVAEAGDTVRIATDHDATYLGSVTEGGQTYLRYAVGLATFGIDEDANLYVGGVAV